MRKQALIVLSLAVFALSFSACKKKKSQKPGSGSTATAAKVATGKVDVPKEVIAYLGIRSPDQTIGGALELVRRFAEIPLQKEMLIDLLLQRAKLHRNVIKSLDLKRTFWMVALDDRAVGELNPAVIALPITSKDKFLTALKMNMKEHEREGDLVTYRPKPGVLGLVEARLRVTETHVFAVSSKKVDKLTRDFVTGNLLPHKPSHAVSLHISMENVTRRDEKRAKRELERAMARLRKKMQSENRPAGVAEAAEKTIRNWAEMMMSTKELKVTFDVDREGLSVSLRGAARKTGRWGEMVKRQRPGQAFGLDVLPKNPWVVFSDRGNPGAQKERKDLFHMATAAIKQDAMREKVAAELNKLSAALIGDLTVAVHQPTGAEGFAISAVARVADEKKAQSALDQTAAAIGAWLSAELKRKGEKIDKLALQKIPVKLGDKANGTVYSVTIPQPPESQAKMEKLLGAKVVFG